MTDPIARTYLSLGAFYASDPARRGSRERDVGLFWRSRSGPSFRAAWVRDTGELYLFQHALGGRGGGSVHLLAPTLTRPSSSAGSPAGPTSAAARARSSGCSRGSRTCRPTARRCPPRGASAAGRAPGAAARAGGRGRLSAY